MYNLNIEARTCNHCRSGKAKSVKYSECAFVALVIQHAMSVRILSSVACADLPYFSKLSHERHDFLEKSLNTMCSNFLDIPVSHIFY